MAKKRVDWETAYLGALGAPNTAANRRLLASWQRWEGGDTNNSARFNYLNTTQKMNGSHSMNSVGVQSYGSLQQGAKAFARTIRNGRYGDLLAGFKSGDPYKANVTAGLSTWLSGSATSPHGHEYAAKVLGLKVAPPAIEKMTTQQPAPNTPQAPLDLTVPRMSMLSGIASGHFDPFASLQALTDSLASQPAATATPAKATKTGKTFKVNGAGYGSWVPGHTSVGGSHPTMGLDGYPARDVFGHAGQAVVSPVQGTVIKLSGHDPRNGPTDGPHGPLGWSVYIKDSHGHTWYVTHLGSRSVKVGQKIGRGTQIGTIANYAKYGTANHAHVGEHK